MKIGERIRNRRKELGLSLRKLGAKVDLSAGYLSQLENDQISPSLNSLQNIATALEVPMFYFLENSYPKRLVRADERHRLSFPDSQISYDLLAPSLTRQMMPLLIKMEPGACRITPPLARSNEQWFFVLQGRLEIIIANETYQLEKGDGIYFDGNLLRQFRSIGEEVLHTICCITPPAL